MLVRLSQISFLPDSDTSQLNMRKAVNPVLGSESSLSGTRPHWTIGGGIPLMSLGGRLRSCDDSYLLK